MVRADIIAIATREAVFLGTPGGLVFRYGVLTGRRDSLVSDVNNVIDIPGPSIPVSDAIALFKKKGLTTQDMVVLLGGHTVGVTHCSVIKNRVVNFNNTGKPDPSMDRGLVGNLRHRCHWDIPVEFRNNIPVEFLKDNPIELDMDSRPNTIDKLIYRQMKAHKGILQIDQAIALDNSTSDIVTALENGSQWRFRSLFASAMVKMGAIEVLTGTQGQIRKNCRVVNK